MTFVVIAVLAAALVLVLLRKLGLRVVGAKPRRKPVTATRAGDGLVRLPESPETQAPGEYVIRFDAEYAAHGILGSVEVRDNGALTRSVSRLSRPLPYGSWPSIITGYPPVAMHPLASRITNVEIPTADGAYLPAWHVPGVSDHWTIHVQGIRTSREVTLRSMEQTVEAGMPTLSVTYRGAGELPTAARSTLGQREWRDLLDAVGYARSQGAAAVTVVAWSMGAGIALELARQRPGALSGLILIAPATNWPQIIRHGAHRAGLPRSVGSAVGWLLGSRIGKVLLALPERVDVERLSWCGPGDLTIPTVVVHSRGDEEIPFSHSEAFAKAHGGLVELVEFSAAPHAWEANVDPVRFAEVFSRYFLRHGAAQ